MKAVALVDSQDREVARPVTVLVPLIQDDLRRGREAAEHAAMPYFSAAGEKMLEAKPQIAHGQFQSWLKRNFKISYPQASRYMAYAKSLARESFGSLREHERSLNPDAGTGKVSWQRPVQKVIDKVDTETLNLKREELKRADERDAQRTLALQLIDIGYKVLARKLHPDRGGSKDAMARLNAVRDRLKQCV